MKLVLKRLLLMMLLVSPVLADSISTIQLQNRPAEEVMPIIRPMLGPGDAISGRGFKLFLRSSPQTLAQVKELLGNLDVAASVLQISVFQGNDRDLKALSISGYLQIQKGDPRVSIGNSNARVGVDAISTRGRLRDNPIHRLRVTEGTEGYIETGEQIPYFSGINWIAADTAMGSIDYKDVTTGFYVLARLHADKVTLQVSPFKHSRSKASAGVINTQRTNTTITGQLGMWLLIGGNTEHVQGSQGGIGSYSSTKSRNNQSIWIKAELVQ